MRRDRLQFAATFGVLLLLAAFVLAWLFLPSFGTPSAQALDYSVTRDLHGSLGERGHTTCYNALDATRTCDVKSEKAQGAVPYQVRLVGHRCWKAQLRDESGEDPGDMETSGHGCVMWRDQLRLFARVFGR